MRTDSANPMPPEHTPGDGAAVAGGGRRRGFTMIELVVTVAVAGIVLALATPGFGNLVLNNRRAAAVNDFVGAMTAARATAVSRRTWVVMCRSAAPGNASPSCDSSSSNAWNTGWIVFTNSGFDPSSSSLPSAASSDELVRTHEALASGATLKGKGTGSGSKMSQYLAFSANGVLANSDAGNLGYCDSRGWTSDARIIAMPTSGRPRTIKQGGSAAPSAITSCSP